MKRTAVVREIRESSEEELRGRLSRLETQLFKLRLKGISGLEYRNQNKFYVT